MAMVHLENVRVDFPIYGAQRSLGRALLQRATGGAIQREGRHGARVMVHALSNVSLRLEDGDRLGLVGHNGSGKSTLLKVIAGIYEPVSGRLTVDGRVTPLLEMMPGLDLGDTGYENIITAGLLHGLSRAEIVEKIPEIEEFCELGEYLTLPVRTYSAGMKMRLGFSLATALKPGILLVDETFGTGDLRFTERAAKRLDKFMERSPIIVLASHSETMIRSICNKAALLHEGQLVGVGSVDEICERYEAMVHANTETISSVPPRLTYSEDLIREVGIADRLARCTGAVRFTRAAALDAGGKSRWTYEPGETITFRFEYEAFKPFPSLGLLFRLCLSAENAGGSNIVTEIREVVHTEMLQIGQIGAVELTLPRLKLMPNRLMLYVWLGRADFRESSDVLDENVGFPPLIISAETNKIKSHGVVSLDHEFRRVDSNEQVMD